MPPGYWMHETSGALRSAVEAYLRHEPMTTDQIAALQSYFRQWIMAPEWQGDGIDDLRKRIDGLTTREAIRAWLALAEDLGIDPL